SRLTQLAEPRESSLRGQPHLAGGAVAGARRLAVDEFGGVQVQARNTKCLSGFDTQLSGAVDLVGTRAVDQITVQVAGHRREPGTGRGKGVEVLVAAALDLAREAEVDDSPDTVERVQ